MSRFAQPHRAPRRSYDRGARMAVRTRVLGTTRTTTAACPCVCRHDIVCKHAPPD